jgi:hypothetical protein
MFFQLTANFSPGDARQTQVQHNRGRHGAAEHFDRQIAVGDRLHRVSFGFKQPFQRTLNSAVILYN